MNSSQTSAGGWESSELRSYIKTVIKASMPSDLQNGIVEVNKIHSANISGSYYTKNGQTTVDDVWIPSVYEIMSSSDYSNTGARYYTSSEPKKYSTRKHKTDAYPWSWLRDAYDQKQFKVALYNGNDMYREANRECYIYLGFCT